MSHDQLNKLNTSSSSPLGHLDDDDDDHHHVTVSNTAPQQYQHQQLPQQQPQQHQPMMSQVTTNDLEYKSQVRPERYDNNRNQQPPPQQQQQQHPNTTLANGSSSKQFSNASASSIVTTTASNATTTNFSATSRSYQDGVIDNNNGMLATRRDRQKREQEKMGKSKVSSDATMSGRPGAFAISGYGTTTTNTSAVVVTSTTTASSTTTSNTNHNPPPEQQPSYGPDYKSQVYPREFAADVYGVGDVATMNDHDHNNSKTKQENIITKTSAAAAIQSSMKTSTTPQPPIISMTSTTSDTNHHGDSSGYDSSTQQTSMETDHSNMISSSRDPTSSRHPEYVSPTPPPSTIPITTESEIQSLPSLHIRHEHDHPTMSTLSARSAYDEDYNSHVIPSDSNHHDDNLATKSNHNDDGMLMMTEATPVVMVTGRLMPPKPLRTTTSSVDHVSAAASVEAEERSEYDVDEAIDHTTKDHRDEKVIEHIIIQQQRRFIMILLTIIILLIMSGMIIGFVVSSQNQNNNTTTTTIDHPRNHTNPNMIPPSSSSTWSPSNAPSVDITSLPTSIRQSFTSREELVEAIDIYLYETYGQYDNTTTSTTRSGTTSSLQDLVFKYGNFSYWDVSNITDFSYMFSNIRNPFAIYFHDDISLWDTSSAMNMSYMFYGAYQFNGDISRWDVSNVIDMTGFLKDAISYTGMYDLSHWNTSNFINMAEMFANVTLFQGIGIELWDVSNVINMKFLFHSCIYMNRNLSLWDVSNVINMRGMFFNTTSFIGSDLYSWNIRSCKSTQSMFYYAIQFDCNVSSWDTSNVAYAGGMFWDASSFRGMGLENWNTSQMISCQYMFYGARSMNANVSQWDVSHITSFDSMFDGAASFIGIGIDLWNVTNAIKMDRMFQDALAFNPNLSLWDISKVKSMISMFDGAQSFQGIGLQHWPIVNPTEIVVTNMLCDTDSFNTSYIINWNISYEDLSCT